ncbi:MAG: ParB/RepB/Spo0J family partition protein [Oscillospiraceae bacterium]|nr:ParB/RepB/Spo0J family partition protein [Oscillospiraceae bacterium]
MLNADLLKKEEPNANSAAKIMQKNNMQNLQNSIIHNIPVKNIYPNPNQPRKDFDERSLFGLAQSIKDYGIIQPLSVRLILPESEKSPPVYELIAGERRLRAVKLLFWDSVPCVIVKADKQVSAEIAIIENLQREDLNFFEQAKAIQKLIELFEYTQEQAARRLSVSQSYIANKLRILKLSEEERDIIAEYGLTERHARSFIRIADEEERKKVIATVIKRFMNVSSTEKYIDKILNEKEKELKKYPNQKATFIIKDVRLFLNTIDKVVDTIAQSGINIKSEKTDKGEYIEIYLEVPKKKA